MLDYGATLLRHGRIDPVEFYVSHEHRVIYVENAKVACTAIKRALFPEADYAALGQERFHETLRNRARYSLPPQAADYLVFSVFRHPARRLFSCYQDKVMRAAATKEGSILLNRRFHRSLFRIFGGIDIRDPGVSFDSFAGAVAQIPDRLSDRHFAAQARFHHAVTSAPRHFVARLEELETDWARLQQLTGLPDLPIANRSTAPDGEAIEISKPATAAIASRYAEDFTLLGYE